MSNKSRSLALALCVMLGLSISAKSQAQTIASLDIGRTYDIAYSYTAGSSFEIVPGVRSMTLTNQFTSSPSWGYFPATQVISAPTFVSAESGQLTFVANQPTRFGSGSIGTDAENAAPNAVYVSYMNGGFTIGAVSFDTEALLISASPLVIHAQEGTPFATLEGIAQVVIHSRADITHAPTNRAATLLAEVGDSVHYSIQYTLLNGAVWDASTFSKNFDYRMAGTINLTPVPEPSSLLLGTLGLVAMGCRLRKVKR